LFLILLQHLFGNLIMIIRDTSVPLTFFSLNVHFKASCNLCFMLLQTRIQLVLLTPVAIRTP